MNKALKTAKPILFNTEMVKAILDGRKTVTRRILRPHNAVKAKKCEYEQGEGLWFDDSFNQWDKDTHIKDYSVSPCWIETRIYIEKYAPYKVGDILYVRETWCKTDCFGLHDGYVYKANDNSVLEHTGFVPKWKPSIHMPKEAARIFLRVTNVRVERLQDMTDEQVVAEGIDIPKTANNEERCLLGFARYSKLWNSTVKKSDLNEYGWNANPFVWVIEFERVEENE